MASEDAAGGGRLGRLARFGAVGASGAIVNLVALHLLAGPLALPELAASALAIELSVLWNFRWNDTFTFRDRRTGAWPARLVRYHLVSAVGVTVQLGIFAAGLWAARRLGAGGLGAARYPVQAAGIALGFAWNFLGASRWAWAARAGARPRRPFRVSLPAALFLALVALHVALLWSVHWFATQDGPLHVENVVALVERSGSLLLQRYYVANWGAQPNWLTQLLLAPLLEVASPRVAERLVLTGYTLLLPFAFRTVLPRGREGWWAALAVFPFLHSFPFFMGFWNFLWGMGLALLVVGWWQRRRGRLGPGGLALLAVAGAGLYLAHAVAFGATCLLLASLLGARAALSLARARPWPARRRRVARAYAGRALGLTLALAPGAALLAAWILAHRDHDSARIPFPELLAKLAAGYALVSIDRRELFLAAGVSAAVGLAVLAALRRRVKGREQTRAQEPRRLLPWDGWLAAAALFAVLYFAIPDVADAGAHISDRFALLAFLSAAAWLGGRHAAPRAVRATGLALAALAVAALGVRFEKERVLSAYVEEYVAAGRVVGRDAVLLPLALAPGGPRDARGRRLGYRVKPFLHATGWIVAAQGGVDLKNSQANTDQCPVRFTPGRNPFQTIAASIGRMEGVPPCVDLRLASRVGPLDYVLLWGATRENLSTPCGAALAEALSSRYDPVWLSEPSGLLEVWRPRVETAVR